MQRAKNVLLLLLGWLALVGVIMFDMGFPSSALGWAALIVFGPIGYLVLAAIGELAMERVSAIATRLRLGSAGRMALLLVVLFPVLLACVYLANR